jgi:hypothetical protein
MILKPAPVSTRQFSYDHVEHRFTAEMSETHGFGRVYDDAADEGLTLVSTKTGAEVVFVLWETEYTAEGEVAAWYLRSVVPGFFMTIFND